FAHMEHVLDRSLHQAFGGYRVERTAAGDTPDYFCAESVEKIYLSEAKGRYSAISFTYKEYASWRSQLNRVVVKDRKGIARSIKGYIVSVRFGTEIKPRTNTTLFAEDPATRGEGGFGGEEAGEFGRLVTLAHYGGIAEKLNQPILAAVLSNGLVV